MKRGQAGEGAAGDAGDGIERETSAMEWFRDQSVRGRERWVIFYEEKMSKLKKFAISMKEKETSLN